MEDPRVLAGFRESGSAVLLRRAITLLAPTSESLVIDIGSGELHVLEFMAREVGCSCLGIESDPLLVISSKSKVDALQLSNVTIAQGDAEFFDFDSAMKGTVNHNSNIRISLLLKITGTLLYICF
jgi:tRNA G46 methylase TrmB